MKATTLRNGFLSCAVALALIGSIGAITPAFATALVCGSSLCSATLVIRPDSAVPQFGGLTFTVPVTITPDARGIGRGSVTFSIPGVAAANLSATLNPDPSVAISGSATNLTGLPLFVTATAVTAISLSGLIDATSSLGLTLSDNGGSPGVTLSTGIGTDPSHLLVANDAISLGPPPTGVVNKGVDVGPFFTDPPGGIVLGPNSCTAFANGTSTCTPFTANNTFSGSFTPVGFMKVDVNFYLSAFDAVGFTGVVTENQHVPEPTTLLLMGSGLLGLVGGWRRYSSRA